jgi:hypothetical protein
MHYIHAYVLFDPGGAADVATALPRVATPESHAVLICSFPKRLDFQPAEQSHGMDLCAQ